MPPRREDQEPARPQQRARRRLDLAERSLACLVQSLEGHKLVIELRSDVIIKARMDSADEYMNLMLSNVTVQTLEGHKHSYEIMYLKGRTIRYVHLPHTLDPAQAIAAQRKKIVDARLENLKHRLRNPLGRLAKGSEQQPAAPRASEHSLSPSTSGFTNVPPVGRQAWPSIAADKHDTADEDEEDDEQALRLTEQEFGLEIDLGFGDEDNDDLGDVG